MEEGMLSPYHSMGKCLPGIRHSTERDWEAWMKCRVREWQKVRWEKLIESEYGGLHMQCEGVWTVFFWPVFSNMAAHRNHQGALEIEIDILNQNLQRWSLRICIFIAYLSWFSCSQLWQWSLDQVCESPWHKICLCHGDSQTYQGSIWEMEIFKNTYEVEKAEWTRLDMGLEERMEDGFIMPALMSS